MIKSLKAERILLEETLNSKEGDLQLQGSLGSPGASSFEEADDLKKKIKQLHHKLKVLEEDHSREREEMKHAINKEVRKAKKAEEDSHESRRALESYQHKLSREHVTREHLEKTEEEHSKEIKTLTNQIQTLKDSVDKEALDHLRRDKVKLESKALDLKQQYDKAAARILELTSSGKAQSAEKDRDRQLMLHQRDQIAVLESRLEKAMAVEKHSHDELQRVQAKELSDRTEVHTLVQRIEGLLAEANQNKADGDKQIELLNSKLNAVTQHADEVAKKAHATEKALSKMKTDSETTCKNAAEATKEAQSKIVAVKTQLVAARTEVAEAQGRAQVAEEQLTAANTKINASSKKSGQQEAMIREQGTQITELKAVVAKSGEWVTQVQSQLEQLQARLAEAESDKRDAEEEVKNQRALLERGQAEAVESAQHRTSQLADMEEELFASRKEHTLIQKEYDAASEQIKAYQKQLRSLEERLCEHQEELTKHKKEHKDLRHKAKDKHREDQEVWEADLKLRDQEKALLEQRVETLEAVAKERDEQRDHAEKRHESERLAHSHEATLQRKEKEALAESKNRIEREMTELRAKLKQQYEEAALQLQNSNSQCELHSAEIDALHTAMKDERSATLAANETSAQLAQENDELAAKVSALENGTKVLKEKGESERKALEAAIEKHEEESKKEMEALLARLEQAAAATCRQEDALRAAEERAGAYKVQAESELASLRNVIDDKEADEAMAVEAFEEELEALQAEKDAAEARESSLQQQLLQARMSGAARTPAKKKKKGGKKNGGEDEDEDAEVEAASKRMSIEPADDQFASACNSPELLPPAVTEHDTDSAGPLLYLYLGSDSATVSFWEHDGGPLGQFSTCIERVPVATAIPRNKRAKEAIAKSVAAAGGLGGHAEAFEYYSQHGLFAGADAHYVCYAHPDTTLRGAVELQTTHIVAAGSGFVADGTRLVHLVRRTLQDAMRILATSDDASNKNTSFAGWDGSFRGVRVAIGFKSTYYEASHLKPLCDALLVEVGIEHLYLLPQHRLALSAASHYLSAKDGGDDKHNEELLHSLIIVDIGAQTTTVVPLYEQIAMNSAVRSCPVGGDAITAALELMLHAHGNRYYAQASAGRRRLLARQLKEKHAYVAAAGLESEVAVAGSFEFTQNDISLKKAGKRKSPGKRGGNGGGTAKSSGITTETVTVTFPDGTTMDFNLGPERFYCTELLMDPGLVSRLQKQSQASGGDKNKEGGEKKAAKQVEGEDDEEDGLVATILQAAEAVDESVRGEVLSTVVITGGPATTRGLDERLRMELAVPLQELGVPSFEVIVADGALMNEAANLLLHHSTYSRHTQSTTAEWYTAQKQGGTTTNDLFELLL
jgi:hypothetical protein